MKCKDFALIMPSFISDTMDENYYDDFVKHVRECDSCREELEIHYMITVGLEMVEGDTTGSFNIPKALNEQLKRYEDKADARFRFEISNKIMFVFAHIGIILVTALYFFM